MDSAWVKDSRLCQFSYLCDVPARLAMRHTHVFGVRILIGLFKMLVLALPQIYTRVFSLWNSIDLDSSWVEDSLPCQFSFLLRILALLAMRQTRVFGIGKPLHVYMTF